MNTATVYRRPRMRTEPTPVRLLVAPDGHTDTYVYDADRGFWRKVLCSEHGADVGCCTIHPAAVDPTAIFNGRGVLHNFPGVAESRPTPRYVDAEVVRLYRPAGLLPARRHLP